MNEEQLQELHNHLVTAFTPVWSLTKEDQVKVIDKIINTVVNRAKVLQEPTGVIIK